MTAIAIFMGPDNVEEGGAAASPAIGMRLASLAASFVASGHGRILLVGDFASILAVGTAVAGTQQERTVEGGERRASPLVVPALLSSSEEDMDQLMGFDSPGGPGELHDVEERDRGHGDLSLLVALGIMDVSDGDPRAGLRPRRAMDIAEMLPDYLGRLRPQKVLVLGPMPSEIVERAASYAIGAGVSLLSVPRWPGDLGNPDLEQLAFEAMPPFLEGRRIEIGTGERSADDGEEVVRVSEEFSREVALATWEAGATAALLHWLDE